MRELSSRKGKAGEGWVEKEEEEEEEEEEQTVQSACI